MVDNSKNKGDFRRNYESIRIGVTNAAELFESPNFKPEFQEQSNGILLAAAIDKFPHYAVFPQFDLTFTEAHDNLDLFKVPDYNPERRNQRMRVVKPALFEVDSSKQQWKLIKKGELKWE